MARMEISTEHKVERFAKYPKLSLKKDERARIICVEQPEVAYVHTFRKPQMINGKPKMIVQHYENREDKEVNAMEWVASDLCLGDFQTVADKGIDSSNCPACAKSKQTESILEPRRLFAMHIGKYSLNRGWTISEPFNLSIVAWTFGDDIYNKLADIRDVYGDLRKYDLLLGPCEVEAFQKYDIKASPDAAEYLASDDRKKFLVDSFKNNQADDLEALCGRRVEAGVMNDHIAEVEARWKLARGESGNDLSGFVNSKTLDEGILSLESSTKPEPRMETPAQAVAQPQGETVDINDLFNNLNL